MASEASLAAAPREAGGLMAPPADVASDDEGADADARTGDAHAGARMCTIQETIRMVGRKWHLILLWELSQRPAGFNELKERADGISAKMLSQSLSDLESSGLVARDILTERPLRTMYHLTEKATELTSIFDILEEWGRRHGLDGPVRDNG